MTGTQCLAHLLHRSNLDLADACTGKDGQLLSLENDIYPEYDIILCISTYSATAPLTAMAKKYHFRGATLHGVNEVILSTGLAVGEMMLRATEMGLIAHPIAGYDPLAIKEKLGIPADQVLITLIICGYPGSDVSMLSEKQLLAEVERPPRKPVGENFFDGSWGNPWA